MLFRTLIIYRLIHLLILVLVVIVVPSWLDHVICSNSVDIRSVDIFYDLTFYDHFPVLLNLNMDCIQNTDVETCDDLKSEFVNWNLLNRDVISRFQTIVDRNLEGLNLCDKIGCNSDHRPQIDNLVLTVQL